MQIWYCVIVFGFSVTILLAFYVKMEFSYVNITYPLRSYLRIGSTHQKWGTRLLRTCKNPNSWFEHHLLPPSFDLMQLSEKQLKITITHYIRYVHIPNRYRPCCVYILDMLLLNIWNCMSISNWRYDGNCIVIIAQNSIFGREWFTKVCYWTWYSSHLLG